MMSPETRAKWNRQVSDLLERDDLTEWEAEFVDSVSIRLSEGRDLTWGQSKKLSEVWQRRCA